jgi:hypothetical protein
VRQDVRQHVVQHDRQRYLQRERHLELRGWHGEPDQFHVEFLDRTEQHGLEHDVEHVLQHRIQFDGLEFDVFQHEQFGHPEDWGESVPAGGRRDPGHARLGRGPWRLAPAPRRTPLTSSMSSAQIEGSGRDLVPGAPPVGS